MKLDSVLIREEGAKWPHAYEELPSGWKVSGIEGGHVVERSFGTREEAEAWAAREVGLTGTWADPDGDGNYCVVG